jgi:hypothetical protein
MDHLRGKEIHPAILVIAVLLIVAVFAYAFWIRPAQEAAQAKANWTTPEAAAARGPGAKRDASYEQAIQNLRQKEHGSRPLTQRRE